MRYLMCCISIFTVYFEFEFRDAPIYYIVYLLLIIVYFVERRRIV